jgi:hypothetical protein
LVVVLLVRVLGRADRWRVLVPLGAGLLIVAGAMGYYNFRITGDALRMPFVEYSDQYDIYPKFWFLPTRPAPPYRDEVMRQLHSEWERGDYDRMRTAGGFISTILVRSWQLLATLVQPLVLVVPLFAGIAVWRLGGLGWIWLALGIFVLGMWAESWFLPHYSAPAIPATLLLVVAGWQWLADWRLWNGRLGRILFFATFCGLVAGAVGWAAAPPTTERFGRADLIASFPQLQEGRHLVFVRYLPGHLLDDEWVYNAADLPGERIVWARAMGESDLSVIQYFAGRQVWLLEVGQDNLRIDPYLAGH